MQRNHQYSESIFQFRPQVRLSNDCIAFENMTLSKGCAEVSCPYCGNKQYGFREAFQLQLFSKIVKHVSDAYITERVFGDGIAIPLYVISQRLYRELKKNSLTAHVSFAPVILID